MPTSPSFRRAKSKSADAFNKFSSSFKRKTPKTPAVSIEDAFKTFDKDGSGSLSVAELQAVLTRPGGGAPLTLEEVAELIAEFDQNDDGELQYEEFAEMWAGSQGVAPPAKQPSVLTRALSRGSGSFRKAPDVAEKKSKSRVFSGRGSKNTTNTQVPPLRQPLSKVSTGSKPSPRTLTPKLATPRLETSKGGTPRAAAPRNSQGDDNKQRRLSDPKVSSAAPVSSSELPLLSAAELRGMSQKADAEAAALVARAGQEGTFERRVGAALLRNENAAKAVRGAAGAKLALGDLLREWDKNKDGAVQKMEFRQAVRGSLKLHATNGEIDALFDTLDADHGGTLDLQELKPALMHLQSAAAEAEAEKGELATLEAEHRKVSSDALEAATAMDAIEIEEQKLASLRSTEGAPVEIRLATSECATWHLRVPQDSNPRLQAG